MSERTTIDLIHEIASEMALAKELDEPLFTRLSALFEDLEREFSTKDDSFRDSVCRCRALLSGIVAGKSDDVDADIGLISSSLTMMYQFVRRKATSRSDGDHVSSSHSSKDGFVLPEEVDEGTFRSIIASLRIVLEEIEEDLVEEAVIDFLEQDSGKTEGIVLRDKFHTLKREARLLGLLDLEQVCLAAEEFLDESMPGVERTDRLLKVKDWITKALDAYAVLKFPDTPYTKIVADLRAYDGTRSGMMDDEV